MAEIVSGGMLIRLSEHIAERFIMGRKEDDHNRGQADGAKADIFDRALHNIDPFTSKHYDKGFQHGADSTLETDFIGDLLNPFSPSSPKDEEHHTEAVSADSEYDYDYYDDDDDDDDYNYSPSRSLQSVSVEPEPEPIIHTTYSRTERGLSASTTILRFKTEEEKAKYLRQEALFKEMLGDEYGEEEEDPEQALLASIFEQIESDSDLDKIIGVIRLAALKKKE